jgi:hypothetical protein
MTKRMRAHEIERRARAKRSSALARNELRQPSVPRVSAAGPTSPAIKAEDPAIRAMIDAAIAERKAPVDD